jgi:uncharacterized protein (DUF952 family)
MLKLFQWLFGLSVICSPCASLLADEESTPEYLYKIVTVGDWNASQVWSFLKVAAYDRACIHLCTKAQIKEIAHKFFSQEAEVLIVTLDPEELQGKLVKEKLPGTSDESYRLYGGFIPLTSVVKYEPLILQQ